MVSDKKKPIHILIAIDGSEQALAGAQMARDLPLPFDSTVTLLSAFLPRNAANYQDYEKNVRQAGEVLAGKGIKVQEEVLAGIPAEVISQYAEDHRVDLIVMGARGLRSAMMILLGGVAQQVVEYAERPVMIMRAPYHGFHHPMIVVDGSPCSDLAVDYFSRFALPKNSVLDIMHVLPPPPIPQSIMIAYAWPVAYSGGEELQAEEKEEIDKLIHQEEAEGQVLLNRVITNLASQRPDLALNGVLRRGDAASEILEYAQEHNTDLIVAGSRGLSNVRGWLLGSVSRKLLHYASCSVLIVRGHPACVPGE